LVAGANDVSMDPSAWQASVMKDVMRLNAFYGDVELALHTDLDALCAFGATGAGHPSRADFERTDTDGKKAFFKLYRKALELHNFAKLNHLALDEVLTQTHWIMACICRF
jgi:hypothetical protein